MKLSSSASCGCCFCCYCRSWLMMLLMVSSVIHVSPDVMTTTTTTTTNTNLNNYYKAMTKSAKFNVKLQSRTSAGVNTLPDGHKGNHKEGYPPLQSDMATTLATVQTPSNRVKSKTGKTGTTTTSSSHRQIATTGQSLYKTTATWRRDERQRVGSDDSVYRSSTDTFNTAALIGDNYDVVTRTTDTPVSIHKSTETIGVAGTRNVQITVLHGDIDNDSKNLKYPRVESSAASKHHGTTSTATTTSTTQHTKRASSISPANLRAVHGTNHNYNNRGEVQRTNIGQDTTETVSRTSKTKQQYIPTPSSISNSTSTSSSNEITIKSSSSTSNNTGNVIKDLTGVRTNAYMAASALIQRTNSDLLQLEYNQLKRPALFASFTQPLHRQTRQVDDEPIDKCRLFEQGDSEKMELYSPDYPNVYPKNINCTRVITAQKGQIIRLDFRNSFHIEEKEDCKFDFLEIRDGQYGFSNLIGKYCGNQFPPEITSKERYLWLHFHSDESIEYTGFTAVYEFIDRTRDAPSTDLNCTIMKDGDEGFVNHTDIPQEIRDTVAANKIALDCMWRIQVQEKWKIQVKFIDFKLSKPNDCDMNFLDIFPEQTVMPLRVKNFCGSAGESVTSESNVLHMRFYAEQQAINSSFSILYTAFRDRGSGGACTEDEYDCEDATCIAGNLKCNQRDNCKFRWDEEGCEPESKGQSEHMTIIITVFGLILGGMVITFLVNCVRKIMHDQKIIREHIRQSKESKLDEMGRNSKARSRDNISIVSPRQKHSQTSLQILDDVSNRYYREMELQAKGNFKEKEPLHIRRHDMIVQTSLCSTDDSSTTTPEQAAAPGGACDMGCQTRESLFGTASLLRSKSKTSSVAGAATRGGDGVPPPPRFSTFGYDAVQQMAATAPVPPTMGGTSALSRRNIHLPQASIEAEHAPNQEHMAMVPPQQQQHRHLHHRPSQEICHHHHQHQQQHQQQQQQQQQQQKQTLPRHQHQHMQEQHHHPSSAGTHITTMPASGTTIVTAMSGGSSAARGRDPGNAAGPAGAGGASKNKQTKVDESKLFIDIRNSAPDVIIMTSH